MTEDSSYIFDMGNNTETFYEVVSPHMLHIRVAVQDGEPLEAIDDKKSRRIIATHARPADAETAFRYDDKASMGERLVYAYMLAKKHGLPEEQELRRSLKRFLPASLAILGMENDVVTPLTNDIKRTYTDSEIKEIVAEIWDTVQEVTATLFDRRGGAIFTRFHSLSDSQQKEGFLGLKHKIETEGLQGYINRKRPAWGEKATNAVIRMLEGRDLLRR
ncbi:MAG: hypothetical protein DDT32_02290 [Syntrophomonadaceae bacterium]|nr:hypothetical protein [Bacillota bacterium]